MPPFIGDKKNKISYHPTYPHRRMATKFFGCHPPCTPSDFLGHHLPHPHHQIWQIAIIKWWPIFFWFLGKGAISYFLESPCRSLSKNMWHTHPFVTIEKFWLPQKGAIKKLSIVTMLVTKNSGHHKVWQLKKFGHHIMWWPIFKKKLPHGTMIESPQSLRGPK